MKPLPRVDVIPIFADERAALVDLLRSFTPEQWAAPTVCAGWSVQDVAAHLLGDDLGRLAGQRDRASGARFVPTSPETFEAELRDFINARNEEWVATARRLSPRVITDMLVWSGAETLAHFGALDPDAPGIAVSWAGESESPNWFDIAREYTERWHHGAQIREGAGAPLHYDERFFAPVIDTMIRAVPHALRATEAPDGAHIRIAVTDQILREYDVLRTDDRWQIGTGAEGTPAATVTMDGDTAWRLLTSNLPREEIVRRSKVDGDAAVAGAVFDTLALVS